MDRLYLAARMPTLIVWGDRDNMIPVSHAYAAHSAIPGSRLEIIENAGHYPHVESPVRFAEIVTDFMSTTEPSSFSAAERRELLLAVIQNP
jgi:pimeloyl-ACP methyl ester carboxylesterase